MDTTIMQRGKVKHYNIDKGYGFIEVDEQHINHKHEDVFFHISNWHLNQSPTVGQMVYFNSKRNDKNQLRATVVAANPDNNQSNPRQNFNASTSPTKDKGSLIKTVVGLLAVLIIGYYLISATDLLNFESLSSNSSFSHHNTQSSQAVQAELPQITGDPDVDNTLYLIQQGGPFPYPNKDGTTFYNREGRLPPQDRGYYHEYTVPTPGVSHRGARRIVTGGNPPTEYYFTDDHYESFTQLQVN